ncbi:hypothetical protein [Halogeometricum sp. CBA1124]|nr:hypothetical protein [Halogeometricum sp. CBA1124]MUV57412.1 hypothetical protein [Halogeometricum sp. CBA1124]
MAQRTRADDQGSATELELYLPAGVSPSFDGSWFDRLWARLFDYRV